MIFFICQLPQFLITYKLYHVGRGGGLTKGPTSRNKSSSIERFNDKSGDFVLVFYDEVCGVRKQDMEAALSCGINGF
jgi:hypothetical protein